MAASWSRKSAWRAGVWAASGTAVGGLLLLLLAATRGALPLPWPWYAAALAFCAAVAGAVTGALTERRVGRRLEQLTGFLEQQTAQGDDLRRLPPLGDDEVGRAAQAVNDLFANMTSLRVSVIDQGRELAATQEELRLKEELAAKSEELEQRLGERALLFDILRISASEVHLSTVVEELARRIGEALRLREFAILLRQGTRGSDQAEDSDRFVIRAVYGFDAPESLLGRSVAPGEGIAGEVAEAMRPIVVPNVAADPQYLAFWGLAARKGSFAAFPIVRREQLVGVMALTRPPEQPLAPEEVRLISAIADQMALAIRHAQLFEELRELSTHDELTGLANRRLLRSSLEMELDRARRFEHCISVLAIDIDNFKQLNDRCGHPTGDAALREVAGVMRERVRRVDTVARTGGEEFVILLPRTEVHEAYQVADKLRQHVGAREFPGGDGQPEGHLTVSIGVASLQPEDEADRLLARADEALYRAKRLGRNRVEVAEESSRKGDSGLVKAGG